ncbi:MAG: Holliday junction resolvase RuvX [Pirellulaceae bacterium]|nr:Holliday junction resolvase RuvX [Pirellulaceae bacterium]HJN10159.1 Holliday junction resolvase RuvX [Pirellulaceae bacterium]
MTDPFPSDGRIAGVDFGHVRIGIAITDPSRSIASPLDNYTRHGEGADATYFRRLVEEERVAGFVVGLPLHMSGDESQKSNEVRDFGAWLARQTGSPVVFHDERFSTVAADALMGEAELTHKQRKKRRDMLAAQIILTSFLERPENSSENDGQLAD